VEQKEELRFEFSNDYGDVTVVSYLAGDDAALVWHSELCPDEPIVMPVQEPKLEGTLHSLVSFEEERLFLWGAFQVCERVHAKFGGSLVWKLPEAKK